MEICFLFKHEVIRKMHLLQEDLYITYCYENTHHKMGEHTSNSVYFHLTKSKVLSNSQPNEDISSNFWFGTLQCLRLTTPKSTWVIHAPMKRNQNQCYHLYYKQLNRLFPRITVTVYGTNHKNCKTETTSIKMT